MMLLGLVIHGAVSYMTPDPAPGWYFRDSDRSAFFDLLTVFIHVFRMPVFFVIAGFFAAMLYVERGEPDFIRNRLRRVALPLAAFWPILFPAVIAGFWYAQGRTGQRTQPSLTALLSFSLVDATFIHLWFLYYLLLFYAAVLVGVRIPLPAALGEWLDRLFRVTLESPLRAIALGAVSAITLLPMETGMLDTKPTFIPYIPGLTAYGVYFAFGWLLYRARDLLCFAAEGAWIHMALGVALFPVNLSLAISVIKAMPHPDPLTRVLTSISTGVVMGLCVFGFLGLFLRYFDSHRPAVRYLTEASYWIYLVHLPFAIWVPGWLVGSGLPAVAKFAITEAVMFTAAMLTYHYAVRWTFIGALLNGRRHA